jgi:hypothetical protein
VKSPKAPKTPDPREVSAAQTQSNRDTAAYDNAISHGNTTTPFGSQTFTSRVDPTTGATVYDQNVSLSPDQQQLYDQQQQQNLALGQTSNRMLGQVDQAYGQPFNPELSQLQGAEDLEGSRQAVSDALYKRQAAYLDPQYQQADTSMRTRLANQGITEGSEAWKNSIDEFNRGKSFDYGQARESSIAGGLSEMKGLSDISSRNRNQQLSEALARRALPLNEFNALRAGSQVDVPQFQNPGNANVQPTDVAGNTWNSYNGNLQAWQARAGQAGATNNGLMSLAAAAMMFSDERVKDEVEPVGMLTPDLGLYEYEYKGDPLHERHTGVMAQEVEQVDPGAVVTGDDGVKRVNYSRVLAQALMKRAA